MWYPSYPSAKRPAAHSVPWVFAGRLHPRAKIAAGTVPVTHTILCKLLRKHLRREHAPESLVYPVYINFFLLFLVDDSRGARPADDVAVRSLDGSRLEGVRRVDMAFEGRGSSVTMFVRCVKGLEVLKAVFVGMFSIRFAVSCDA